MYPYIMSRSSISIVIDGKNHVVQESHPNFLALREAIKTNDEATIPSLIDIPKAIASWGVGEIEVFDDVIHYQGEPLANPLCDRILRMMAEGFDPRPMAQFLENLMQNPSRTAVQELYLFLEANGIPITPDGHFLAYKRVRPDYRDIHSGRFDNSVGCILEMARNKVDEDRQNTCSYGFHVCSLSYLPNFSSHGSTDHVMIVKVNPRDVVAVPADYNNAKMRVARYVVIEEYKGDWNRDAFHSVVVDDADVFAEPEVEETEDSYTVKLVAFDDDGNVHTAYVTVTGNFDEYGAKDTALADLNGDEFSAEVDQDTIKAVSATLVD